MLKKNNWIKKIIKWIAILIAVFVVSVFLFHYSVSLGFFGHLYSKKELKSFQNEVASQVFTEDGVLIGKFFDKNRTNVTYEQLPPHLVHALIAVEDARYFEHEGIDFRSLVRVLFKTIIMGDKSAGGGSTITQQLLKNMYGRQSFGPITMLVNKNKEMILARRLESVYNKEEILTLYLNTIPFGESIYGIGSASQRFFSTSVSDLNIQESAVLIGMLKANTYYNPRLYPERATQRRNVVIRQMEKYEYLTHIEADSLISLPLELNYGNLNTDGIANYFLVQVRKEASDILENINEKSSSNWDIEKDGLIINTTLNHQMQTYAAEAFYEHLSEMQKRLTAQYNSPRYTKELQSLAEKKLKRMDAFDRKEEKHKQYLFDWEGVYTDSISTLDSIKHAMTLLHAGMVALDPETGAVRIWVGGIDFHTQSYDQILAKRQLASTFKPILYAAALEVGKMPCDYIDNDAVVLSDYDNWSPENYDHFVGGKYSLAASLAYSKNIPTVRLLFEVGFDEVNYLWKKMGFEGILEDQPSLALGTAAASVLELANAYATFANGGYSIEQYMVQSIVTPDGDTLYVNDSSQEREKIMEDKTSILMNAILQKAINEGTGASLRNKYQVDVPLAGKTGTSQGYADAWFVAYNPSIIMVSRVGASSPSIHFSGGGNGSGSRLALPLIARCLAKAQNDPDIKNSINQDFNSLPDEFADALSCDDYMEDTNAEKIIGIFKKKETNLEKEQKRAARKKKRELRRKARAE